MSMKMSCVAYIYW